MNFTENQFNYRNKFSIEEFESKIKVPIIYEDALKKFTELEYDFLSYYTDFISLNTFQAYLKVPMIFSNKLYRTMSNGRRLLKEQYVKEMYKIRNGKIIEKIKFMFDFFCFNNNDYININDVKIFVNNIVLGLYNDFNHLEAETNEYINQFFKYKKDLIKNENFNGNEIYFNEDMLSFRGEEEKQNSLKNNANIKVGLTKKQVTESSQNFNILNFEDFKTIILNFDGGLYFIFYFYLYIKRSYTEEILQNIDKNKENFNIYKNDKGVYNNKNTNNMLSIFSFKNESGFRRTKTSTNFNESIQKSKSGFLVNVLEKVHIQNINDSSIKLIKKIFGETNLFNGSTNYSNSNFSNKLTHKNTKKVKKYGKDNYLEEKITEKFEENSSESENNNNNDILESDDSLNELSNFENELISLKYKLSKALNSNQTTKSNSPKNDPKNLSQTFKDIHNKTKLLSKSPLKYMLTSNQENFSPKNTNKEITDDLEKILIQFNHSNQIHHYYMNILPPFLFLYNKQLNLSLIPLQRLFKKDSGEVKIENSLYYYVTYNSMISRLSFSIYFDEKEKVIELENEINIKFYEKVIFDDYEILYNKKIGNGNFSNVYLCKSLNDEKIYCVKVINRDLLHGIHSSSLNKEIVNHEIDIAKNILMKSHNKYIINCKGVYESLNEVYIIYKYIKNGNLITFLKNKIREKPEDKLKLIDTILYQLIKAVTYVQKLGVSHRDIKPDNVLVDVKKNGKFKIQLIDYGLSKCISYSEEMNLNVGSLVFTAPEILLNYKYRMNIDTWSCGIMAYFLLFDNLPFNINSSEDEPDLVKQKIIQSKFKFPYVNNEKNKLDEKIRKFIELALEKDKNIRPFMKDIIYD